MRKRQNHTPTKSPSKFFNFDTIADDGRYILVRSFTEADVRFESPDGRMICDIRKISVDTRDHLKDGSFRDNEAGYPETHSDIIRRARLRIHPGQDNVASPRNL